MSAEKVIFTHSLTDTASSTNARADGRNGTSVQNGVLLTGLTIVPNQAAFWHPLPLFPNQGLTFPIGSANVWDNSTDEDKSGFSSAVQRTQVSGWKPATEPP